MLLLPTLSFLLLNGCTGGVKDRVDDTAGGDNSGGDNSGGDDSGDGTAPAATLGYDLSGAFDGTTFSMTWVDFHSVGSPTLVTGAAAYSEPAAARLDLTPETPAASLLQDVDGAASAQMAYFVPTLHEDTDGDGVPSASERYLGAAAEWAIYVVGDTSAVAGMEALVPGWNSAVVSPDGVITVGDPAAIALDAALVVDDNLTVAGGWLGEIPVGARMAIVSAVATGGGSVAVPALADDVSGAKWSMVLAARPPEDHFLYLDRAGMTGAIENVFSYLDTDVSGAWSFGDATYYLLCKDTSSVSLVYFESITNFQVAVSLASVGASAGWIPLKNDKNGSHPMPESELGDLLFAAQCAGGA